MTDPHVRLGIDFGTSTTVAVLRRPDGRVQQLLFDGSPLLSSAVLLGTDGRLHTGRDAAHLARSAPERFEPNPKRRIDDTSVLLADAEVDVRDLVMSVLGRVAAEATRVAAGPVRDVTLTHPANWGTGRRAVLVDAARGLGFETVELVAEPVAAATSFAFTHGAELPVGSFLLVYDLGAGTCDVTLLRRRPDGFELVASDGLNDLGGLDVDAAVVEFLQSTYGRLWTDAATRRRLWDDARSAKEMLSRASHTVIMVPALGTEVPLGREQLEGLARPVLRPSVAMTRALVAGAGVRPADIGGLFLVGGSSRIPLVATMLHEALGIAPVIAEQPELVVAEGALRMRAPAVPLPAPLPPAPVSGSSSPPAPAPVPEPRAVPVRRRSRRGQRTAAAAIGTLVLAAAAVLVYQAVDTGGANGATDPQVQASSVRPKYDFTKAPDNLCDQVDLTAFQSIYQTQEEPARPSRNLTGQMGTATCEITRVYQHGAVIGRFVTSVTIRSDPAGTLQDYRQIVGDTARVNDTPVAVSGLGDEAVEFQMKDSSQRAKTDLTLMIGVRDHNLVWTMRLSTTRSDSAGWTTAQRQDLRDRLLTVTRTSLPKVAAVLT